MYGIPNLDKRIGFIRAIASSVLAVAVGLGVLHETNAHLRNPFSNYVISAFIFGILLGYIFTYIEKDDATRARVNHLPMQVALFSIISLIFFTILLTSIPPTYPSITLTGFGIGNMTSIIYFKSIENYKFP